MFCLSNSFKLEAISVVPGCPSGTYFSGVSNCTLCPQDSYNNINNHKFTNCTSCPEGYPTKDVGSTARAQCECEYLYSELIVTGWVKAQYQYLKSKAENLQYKHFTDIYSSSHFLCK